MLGLLSLLLSLHQQNALRVSICADHRDCYHGTCVEGNCICDIGYYTSVTSKYNCNSEFDPIGIGSGPDDIKILALLTIIGIILGIMLICFMHSVWF